MKTFVEQAEKNGATLISTGPCQFCNAPVTGGVFECFDVYSNAFSKLDLKKSENHVARFLSVDAHALQHPEVHGRWNNHLHLTRLHLILERKFHWDYKKTPILSDVLKSYKQYNSDEYITPPLMGRRGLITVSDIQNAQNTIDLFRMVNEWAMDVYHAYADYHATVFVIADQFEKSVWK